MNTKSDKNSKRHKKSIPKASITKDQQQKQQELIDIEGNAHQYIF
jgi:hypothetical protein